jgi:hypothetical protein
VARAAAGAHLGGGVLAQRQPRRVLHLLQAAGGRLALALHLGHLVAGVLGLQVVRGVRSFSSPSCPSQSRQKLG